MKHIEIGPVKVPGYAAEIARKLRLHLSHSLVTVQHRHGKGSFIQVRL